MSGFSLNHSDTGGYTTLIEPPVQRSAELLERWAEMNAFGGAMFRTHEGNRPQLNVQPYSSPQVAHDFARWARVFRALGPYRQRAGARGPRERDADRPPTVDERPTPERRLGTPSRSAPKCSSPQPSRPARRGRR